MAFKHYLRFRLNCDRHYPEGNNWVIISFLNFRNANWLLSNKGQGVLNICWELSQAVLSASITIYEIVVVPRGIPDKNWSFSNFRCLKGFLDFLIAEYTPENLFLLLFDLLSIFCIETSRTRWSKPLWFSVVLLEQLVRQSISLICPLYLPNHGLSWIHTEPKRFLTKSDFSSDGWREAETLRCMRGTGASTIFRWSKPMCGHIL